MDEPDCCLDLACYSCFRLCLLVGLQRQCCEAYVAFESLVATIQPSASTCKYFCLCSNRRGSSDRAEAKAFPFSPPYYPDVCLVEANSKPAFHIAIINAQPQLV